MSASRRQSHGPDLADKLNVLMNRAFVGHAWDGSARIPRAIQITASPISKPLEFLWPAMPMFPSFSSGSRILPTEKFGCFPPKHSARSLSSTTTSRHTRWRTNSRKAWCATCFWGCRSGNGWRCSPRFQWPSRLAGRSFCCWRFRAGSGSSSDIAPTCTPTAACPSRC